MKKLILFNCMLIIATTINAQEGNFPKLTGPYIGQKPPLNAPELFFPGVVSNERNHSSVAISPDGNEFYWSGEDRKIWFTKVDNGYWTKPELISFCKYDSNQYDNPCLTTDGKKMFVTSFRIGAVSQDKETIWYSEKTSSGWSDLKPISSNVNETPLHWSISISDSGTLYFQFQDITGKSQGGIGDIYYSKLVNGEYTKPVSMEPVINTSGTETCPHIAPDESYIIFTRILTGPEDSGIFISYKNKSGNWLPATMLEGGSIEKGGLSPRISPDGKYLFYVTGGMWWMPIENKIIELRPKE
ncbi:MAG: PD40 domain-containing protein [Ignavibacteriales bacterium]|nr:PD40 domain-containing protein [Ignavibacteriales bacterium]